MSKIGSVRHRRIGNTKWCYVCRQYKNIEEFGLSRSAIDGHVNICRACKGAYQKPYQAEYYLRNRDTLLPKHRESAKLSVLRRKYMENIDEMRARHKAEIKVLQDGCKHEKSTRLPYMWAPGHYGPDVEVCDFCGKILREYVLPLPKSVTKCSGKRIEAIGKPFTGKREVIIPIVEE